MEISSKQIFTFKTKVESREYSFNIEALNSKEAKKTLMLDLEAIFINLKEMLDE